MKINDYLAALGDTPLQVATSLEKQGIKGKRFNLFHCPLVRGVNTHCATWSGLMGCGSYGLTYNDPQITDPACPEACRVFMGRFDGGEFPELQE